MLQLFQGQKKAPAPKPVEAASSGGGLSLPSVSLPSVGLPSISLPSLPTPDLSGLNITPGGGGGIDPRVIALPGKASTQAWVISFLEDNTIYAPISCVLCTQRKAREKHVC